MSDNELRVSDSGEPLFQKNEDVADSYEALPSTFSPDKQGQYLDRVARLAPINPATNPLSRISSPRRQYELESVGDRARAYPRVTVNPGYNNENNDPNFKDDCRFCQFGARHEHVSSTPEEAAGIVRPPNPGYNSDPIYTAASKAYFDYNDKLEDATAEYNEHLDYAKGKILSGEDIDTTLPKLPELPAETKAIREPSPQKKISRAASAAKKLLGRRDKVGTESLRRIGEGNVNQETGKAERDLNYVHHDFLNDEDLAAIKAEAEARKGTAPRQFELGAVTHRVLPQTMNPKKLEFKKNLAFKSANNERLSSGLAPYESHEEWEADKGPWTY
jgi:hypothetical protein